MATQTLTKTLVVGNKLVIEIPSDFLVNSFELGITTNMCGTVNNTQEMLEYFKRQFEADDPSHFRRLVDLICSQAIEDGELFVDFDDEY